MNRWKLWTGRLLIISGLFLVLAIVPLFFPVSWMQPIHQWLLGEKMPESSITIYLARSTSLMYAVHGFVMLYCGIYVGRLWPMVWLLAILHVLIGLSMIYVDVNAGMPLFWKLGEGAPIAGLGGLLFFLWRKGESTEDELQQL